MYTLYNVHVFTPTCTVQYVISCAVNIRLQLYTCFLTMRSKQASSKILNDIGRNSLLGNKKKIAKFLMRTLTCRSTFLNAMGILCRKLTLPGGRIRKSSCKISTLCRISAKNQPSNFRLFAKFCALTLAANYTL